MNPSGSARTRTYGTVRHGDACPRSTARCLCATPGGRVATGRGQFSRLRGAPCAARRRAWAFPYPFFYCRRQRTHPYPTPTRNPPAVTLNFSANEETLVTTTLFTSTQECNNLEGIAVETAQFIYTANVSELRRHLCTTDATCQYCIKKSLFLFSVRQVVDTFQ